MAKLNPNMEVVLCDYISKTRIITTLGQLHNVMQDRELVNPGMVYKFYSNKEAYTGKSTLKNLKDVAHSRPINHRGDSLFDNYHRMIKCEILYNIPIELYDQIETLELWKAELKGLTFSKRGYREWTGDLINKDKKVLNRKTLNNILLYGDNKNIAFEWQTYFN